jgi:hypothetical protein
MTFSFLQNFPYITAAGGTPLKHCDGGTPGGTSGGETPSGTSGGETPGRTTQKGLLPKSNSPFHVFCAMLSL